METRTERVVVETGRHRIVGDITLPREGYRSRLSEYLNHGDVDFIPMVDAELTPLAVTSAAQRWLAEIDDGHDAARALPWAVLSLAARALGGEHGPWIARVRTRAGRWISLYAERLATDPVEVTMIVEPCRPTEIAQIIADVYQLTRRERDIVRLLSTGHSRADIARLLVVSSHTVDDHIKRVYGKLGVRSRPELTAKIFFDQHIPRIHHDVPVGGTGWFLR